MNYKQWLAEQLAGKLEGVSRETLAELIEYPPNPQMGDLSLPCFKLSKQLRKAPQAIAEELKAGWSGHALVSRIDAVSGYFNVYLDPEQFASQVVNEVLTQATGTALKISGKAAASSSISLRRISPKPSISAICALP